MKYSSLIRSLVGRYVWIVCIVVLAGCGNAFTPAEDAELGKQMQQEIMSHPEQYPILNDATIRNYVQNVTNRILQSPEIEYRSIFPYSVQIINDSKTVNAFCTPGGYIYVYTGLMKTVDNEATLAGVIGHEIAHAELRHSTQRITKAYSAQLILGIVLGKNPSMLEEIVANLFTGLALLKNSRDDEAQADEYSFRYLRSTQWYPGAIIYFFQEAAQGEGMSSFQEFFSTHPSPPNRVEAMEKRLRDAKIPQPTEADLNARGYMQIKRQLP